MLRDRGCGLLVMGFFALAFLAIGVWLGLFAGAQLAGEARDIAALPELDILGFRRAAVGERVVVTGALVDNAEITGAEGFLIYLEQEWDVTYDDEDGWEGDWETVRTVTPDCKVSITGGRLRLYRNLAVDIDGAPHETIVHIPDAGQEVNGIVAGTVRRIGFKDDDLITAVGAKTDGEGLTPDRLFGGDRAGLVDYLKGEALGLRIVGGVFTLFAIGMLIASAVTIFRRR